MERKRRVTHPRLTPLNRLNGPNRAVPNWMRGNVRRHLRMWDYRPIGKRMTGKDGRPRLLWALHRLIRLLTSL